MNFDLLNLLEDTTQITIKAGKTISDNVIVKYKDGDILDPQTRADLDSESFLKNKLQKLLPSSQFLGEESSNDKLMIDPNVPTWVIDPLDGTTNFSKNIPLFVISTSLWLNNGPIIGVVYSPSCGQLFTAALGNGAFCNGVPIQVSKTHDISQSIIACDWPKNIERRKHINYVFIKSLDLLKDIVILRCAALAICYVATGAFDGYFNYQLYPWDYGAGILIVKEAGGCHTNSQGNSLLLNEQNIIVSNGRIQNQLITLNK